jgi:hypothetical protein
MIGSGTGRNGEVNMGKDLIPVSRGKLSVLYKRMQTAIADCYSVDDCKRVAKHAAAIAAYYHQIEDDKSYRKFLQIKLRAWRRIGEILVACGVDRSTCETTAEYIRKIRAKFEDSKEVQALSDHAIRQAIAITSVPGDFFEKNVGEHLSLESLIRQFEKFRRCEWEATPEGQAELQRREQARKEYVEQEKTREETREEQILEQARKEEKETAEVEALMAARDAALDEVGITLERRDREQMHQIVFLLKKSIHEILRQAAFDNRMTMQSILRAGLMMWFIAHGYNVPSEDMKLPRRDEPTGRRKNVTA